MRVKLGRGAKALAFAVLLSATVGTPAMASPNEPEEDWVFKWSVPVKASETYSCGVNCTRTVTYQRYPNVSIEATNSRGEVFGGSGAAGATRVVGLTDGCYTVVVSISGLGTFQHSGRPISMSMKRSIELYGSGATGVKSFSGKTDGSFSYRDCV